MQSVVKIKNRREVINKKTNLKKQTEILESILKKTKKHVLFCLHGWIYWRYTQGTRLHRCCAKCYKKQKNNSIVKASTSWSEYH